MFKCNQEIIIDDKTVGKSASTYFIADIAANHDGDLGRAKDLIYRAKDAGADAAKFQHFRAELIVSDRGFKSLGSQQSHQANWSNSVFDVYKSATVSRDWTESLKETCDSAGITFFTSPYDLDTVDYIDPFVPAYKIGSGDITWLEIIEHVASKNKPYLIATGASSFIDVQRAVNAGLSVNPNIVLMQCNTNYTGSLENMRYVMLKVLETYRSMYPDMILGLSDHTPGHASVLGAIALGAKVIEKHFTDDTKRDGPDHKFSMDPTSWKEMVERSRELEAALGTGDKKIENNELQTVVLQRRSIRVKNNLPPGHKLQPSDLEYLRPCPVDAIPPFMINEVVGKVTRRSIQSGEYLKLIDLDENE